MEFVIHVNTVIENAVGQFLLVQEGKGNVGKWNLPGGHLEFGEGLIEGAVREAKEETDMDIEPTRILLISSSLGQKQGIGFVFYAEAKKGQTPVPQEGEIMDCRWFSPPEILMMPNDSLLNWHKIKESVRRAAERDFASADMILELGIFPKP